MKKKSIISGALTFLLLMLIPMLALAGEPGGGIDDVLNKFFGKVFGPFVSLIFYSITVNGVSFPLIVGWLIVASIILTVYMGFIQFKGVKHSIDLIRGVYSNPEDAGEVSHFQALATAVSGTVGIGNIGGVAVAMCGSRSSIGSGCSISSWCAPIVLLRTPSATDSARCGSTSRAIAHSNGSSVSGKRRRTALNSSAPPPPPNPFSSDASATLNRSPDCVSPLAVWIDSPRSRQK